MHGWMDRWKETGKWTERWGERGTDAWMDGRTDGQMDDCMRGPQESPSSLRAGGPGATVGLVDGMFLLHRDSVARREGDWPRGQGPGCHMGCATLDKCPLLSVLVLPALPAVLGCPQAQGRWQRRNDLGKAEAVCPPQTVSLCGQIRPKWSGTDMWDRALGSLSPSQVSFNTVMMLLRITKSKTVSISSTYECKLLLC